MDTPRLNEASEILKTLEAKYETGGSADIDDLRIILAIGRELYEELSLTKIGVAAFLIMGTYESNQYSRELAGIMQDAIANNPYAESGTHASHTEGGE